MSDVKESKGVLVRLENVRHTFTYLFDPYTNKEGKSGYRDTFLIEPGSENDKAIRKAISQAAKNGWGSELTNQLDPTTQQPMSKAQVMVKAFKPQKNKFCYREGNDNIDKDGNIYEGFAGMQYLAANSKSQPTLVNEKNQFLVDGQSPDGQGYAPQLGKASDKLFSGAYVTASVEIWPQLKGEQGIRCQVRGVRHVRDAARLGGGGGGRANLNEFGPPPGQVDGPAVGGNPDDADIPF